MAEKSFGVKEINLIGASGTPTIESPNNLNLNAVNVAISTNVSVGGTLTVSGNLSVGGTITYDDVTNIDSVGIITAREGIFLPDSKSIQFGNTLGSADGFIESDGANFVIEGGGGGTGATYLRGRTVRIEANGGSGGFSGSIFAKVENGAEIAELHAAGTKKLETSTSGVNIDGSVNIVYYSISSNGASAYRFTGGGVDTTEDNPDIYLVRGYTYRFYNSTGSNHPFAIRSAVTNSGGTPYTNGVSGNQNNYQTFTVPLDAPSNLYYQCTIHTQNMQGNIYVTGGQNPFIQQWRLTSNKSTSSTSSDISANLEIVDSGGYGGTSGTMTESSGVFTFPSTGIYLIMAKGSYSASGGATSNYNEMDLHTTTDGSTFNRAAIGWCYIASGGYGTASCDFVFNVTNTSTHKVKFRGASASSSAYLTGNTNDNQTHFTFMKITAN